MLDTNMASFIIRRAMPGIREKFENTPKSQLCLSIITEAELLYGLALKPLATNLGAKVHQFLENANILLWDHDVAKVYAHLRADLKRRGKSISVQDTMIAAHAMMAQATLVTNDKAFRHIEGLKTADWTLPQS